MRYFIILCFFLISLGTAAQNLKTHKVQEGESIEDIAKSYFVSPYDIYALNPDAMTDFRSDMVLIIPNSRVKNEPLEEETKEVIGYRTHKVKRKQTLYSISKEYDISIDDIKKYNERLYSEQLKKGDRIRIPRFKTIINQVTYDNTLKKYAVRPKEGKWRVAYKFGITVQELEALNPDINTVLQPGDLLNVPNIANNEENVFDDAYNYYEVQPKEGFYRLEIKLGLTQSELESLNPELLDGGLKEGMILKVPLDTETLLVEKESTKVDLRETLVNFSEKRLAVMLPFQLHKIDTDSIGETKEFMKTDRVLSITLDFHAGVLLALDFAKQLGISTKLDVYDTKRQTAYVTELAKSNDFRQYDAVIGPLITRNFDRMAAQYQNDSVAIINPFSKPSKLYGNTVQTIPKNDFLSKRIIEHIKKDTLIDKIVIIADRSHNDISDQLKKQFPAAKQIFSNLNKEEEQDAFFIVPQDLEEVFVEGRNMVFLETNNPAFASNVISMLNGTVYIDEETEEILDINIELTTTNHNRAFETEEVDNNHLSKLKFVYASTNKFLSSQEDNTFVRAYKNEYGVYPSKYAIRGFDLTLDVLLRLASSNRNLINALYSETETEYTENKFNYIKDSFGGFVNQTAYIVQYQDLEIIQLD
ncbi:MAG: LysM peptidoglycan-binding domain-containing protein [Bacteroidota bacterium]